MSVWFFGAMAAGLTTALLIDWLRDSVEKLRREIRSFPRVALGDAPENEPTRISGTLELVDPNDALIAPISGRPCAAWHVVVSRLKGETWHKELEDSQSQAFLLHDGHETAYVEGEALELLLLPDATEESEIAKAPSPQARRFMRAHGIGSTRDDMRRRTPLEPEVEPHAYRIDEGILEDGERVTVVGVGRWETDPSRGGHGYRDVGRRFRLRALDDGRVLASDEHELTKDGG